MKLKSEQLGEFSSILQDAFDLFRFDEMLSYHMGINRQNIALGANFAEIVFRVLSHFQARHTTTDLVMAAREANSENPDLILDYALLRVKDEPGKKRVGGKKGAPSAPTRKWINVPCSPPEIIAEAPLYIMQHPNYEPLKLAIDTSAIIGVNGNGTRVRYRTNTERGSSGAPCFNKDWCLIGELATRAEGPVRQCRLVLLNYTEMLPADIDHFIGRETIRRIGREDLISFFNHLFSVKGRAL